MWPVFVQLGCHVGGFDAYVTSTVLPGSGLSSSAAFEVLLGTILNGLFGDGKWTGLEIAMAGQYAEQVHFGKPCGLMDQMASAVGSLVTMDFLDPQKPVVRPVAFDFSACDHALCIVDSGANHAGLTEEYAAITQELKLLCGFFKRKSCARYRKRSSTLPSPLCAICSETGLSCGPSTFIRRTSGCWSRWLPWRPGILVNS